MPKAKDWEKEIDKRSKDQLTMDLAAFEQLKKWEYFSDAFQLGYFNWMVPYMRDRIEKLAADEEKKSEPMIKQKMRISLTGKIHLSGGLNAANCSAGNRGMSFNGRVAAENAFTFPKENFCRKCFGSDPYKTIDRMVKNNHLE